MNTRILLLAISVAAFSSCSVYKNGQTPDDMYYSPAPAARLQAGNNPDNDNGDSYVNVNQPKQGSNFQSYDEYQDSYRDDRFLRMSVGNPYYMDSYNSYGAFDWRYNSFYNGFNYGFSSPWNNYFAWNSFYNPYAPLYYGYGGGFYGGGYYSGGGGYYGGGVKSVAYTTPISRPVTFNVNNYTNGARPNTGRNYLNANNYNNTNGRYNNNNGNNNRNNNSYYNNNNNARSTYTPATNSNSNSNSAPSRSYSPSSSGSSGGGGGSVSRPSRN